MKKILILVIIAFLIVIAYLVAFNGISLGSFRILSYRDIANNSNELEERISEASKLTSVSYPERLGALDLATKELVNTKERYEEKVAFSSADEVERATQFIEYELEFLWAKLGNYAEKHGLSIDLNIIPNQANSLSDLRITMYGRYISIADFIHDVEDDSKLGFKVQNFKIIPSTDNSILKAEFEVKEVEINIDTNVVESLQLPAANPNTNNTNTTNSTNNTNTTNSTNNTTNTNASS